MRTSVTALRSFAVATLVGLCATPFPAFGLQEPCWGRFNIPGRIEAERFDCGNEGESYHDSTPTNEPGAFRHEGVDVEASSSATGGYDVGWVTPGEWLEYTVGVGNSEPYNFVVRYASQGFGGIMHIELNGIDVTGPITLSDTGGWQNWSTVTVSHVNLPVANAQAILRLSFDQGNADGWLANIDNVEISKTQSSRFEFEWPRIEAENFDDGGEGLAYHDATPQNEPGAYRPDEGVDIEVTSDEGGGYDVGWIRPGEWLEYSRRAGSEVYTFHIRHASAGPGGTVHIEINGVDRTGPIVLPDTGGWQNWQTLYVQKRVFLPGTYTMRLVFDEAGTDGWLANINYIDVRFGPWPRPRPTAEPLPGIIEAEHFSGGGEGVGYHDMTPQNEPGAYLPKEGVDIEVTADVGGGYDVGWIQPGEWLMYNVFVEPGTYTIEIRHAAAGPGGTMHMELDGENFTGPIVLPDTGGWQSWQTLAVPGVRIPGGRTQLLRLAFDAGNAEGWLSNINWVRFTRTGP